MTAKTYQKMYERYAMDYSKGLRDWVDFASAVSRLNQIYNSSLRES